MLDCLTAHGVSIPSSCHAGICQTCLMQVVAGSVPASAQPGLKNTLVAQNYFLACSFLPEGDIEVRLPMTGSGRFSATVVEIDRLNTEVVCLKLAPDTRLKYKAGQFINLYKDKTTSRSYSLASVPEIDDHLQFHIRKLPNGLVGHWVHHELKIGDTVEISDASGDCFYVPDVLEQNLLLIATGTGLAPLYGIVRDALFQGHTGAIKLYHGSNSTELLYLSEELKSLALKFDNFIYAPCVSGKIVPSGFVAGRAQEVALEENPDLSGWRVFLCGHPEMVSSAKKLAFLAGASTANIYADPFVLGPKSTS